MKKLKAVLFLSLIIGFSSCDENDGYITDEITGAQYKFIEKGNGKIPGPDDVMLIQMENVLGDSILKKTITKDGLAMTASQGPGLITTVLKMCAEGDSVHIKMSVADYGMATRTIITKGMDTTKNVIMKMRISKVVNREDYIAEKEAEAIATAEKQKFSDIKLIEKYISENNLTAKRTGDGLFYVVKRNGKGKKPKSGESVSVEYTVKLLDGTFIDSSSEELSKENDKFSRYRDYGPLKFKLGAGAVIKGWDLGIGLISKGTKAMLLIPSDLAYGPTPREGGGVPPNAILIFEVELVEIGE